MVLSDFIILFNSRIYAYSILLYDTGSLILSVPISSMVAAPSRCLKDKRKDCQDCYMLYCLPKIFLHTKSAQKTYKESLTMSVLLNYVTVDELSDVLLKL